MNWLRNLKVVHKLSLALAVLVVGFALIGLAYQQVVKTDEFVRKEERRALDFGQKVNAVLENFLRVEAIEKDFLIEGSAETAQLHAAAMEKLFKSHARLTESVYDEDQRQVLASMRALIKQYQEWFVRVAQTTEKLGFDENSGLQGRFRNNVHEVEDLLNKEMNQLALTVSMLSMRRHEKDFILRQNDKYVQKLEDEYKRFNTLLKTLSMSSSLQAQIGDKIEKYHNGFLELVNGTKSVLEEVGKRNTAIDQEIGKQFAALTKAKDAVLNGARAQAERQGKQLTVIFISVLVLTGGIAFALLAVVSRTVAGSLSRLLSTVSQVGQGDFNARSRLQSGDELGELGRAFDTLLDERLDQLRTVEKENEQLNDSIITLMEAASKLSEKDLTVKVPVMEDVTGPVADAMNMMSRETARVLREISAVAEQVEQASNTVKGQGEKVSAVAANERKIVEDTIVRLEAASKSMSEIAALAQNCNDIATKASNTTEQALLTVNNTVEGMNEIRETISETEKRIKRLGERSQEISGIVEMINSISERTQVLALNASMQAAAAGEAGRGFAVVADEVQRLAESSRTSTSQIGALVKNIQAETAETMATMNKTISQVVGGSKLAEQAGKQMAATRQTTSEMVSAVAQIAEQSVNQAKVSKDLRARATIIQKSTKETSDELVEQTAQTENLVQYSGHLLNSVRVFKLPAA
jgi:methyl-accepting chemotaxis protein